MPLSLKIAPSHGSGPHLINGSLCPPKSLTQMASGNNNPYTGAAGAWFMRTRGGRYEIWNGTERRPLCLQLVRAVWDSTTVDYHA